MSQDANKKTLKFPLMSIYACRFVDQNARTNIGWSITGGDCTYVFNGKVKTDIGTGGTGMLVRDADKLLHVDTSVDEDKKK